jgi:hypothetical protein
MNISNLELNEVGQIPSMNVIQHTSSQLNFVI